MHDSRGQGAIHVNLLQDAGNLHTLPLAGLAGDLAAPLEPAVAGGHHVHLLPVNLEKYDLLLTRKIPGINCIR